MPARRYVGRICDDGTRRSALLAGLSLMIAQFNDFHVLYCCSFDKPRFNDVIAFFFCIVVSNTPCSTYDCVGIISAFGSDVEMLTSVQTMLCTSVKPFRAVMVDGVTTGDVTADVVVV